MKSTIQAWQQMCGSARLAKPAWPSPQPSTAHGSAVQLTQQRRLPVLQKRAEGRHTGAGPHHEQRELGAGRQAQRTTLHPNRQPHVALRFGMAGSESSADDTPTVG